MSEIPETYVSPNLRMAFLREDHPDADVEYAVVPAADSPVHPAFRGDTVWFVTATITVGGKAPVTAWKEVPTTEVRWVNNQKKNVEVEPSPELLVKVQTMALGRALKAFGYPDDLNEFKSLTLWRRRNRELALLGPLTPAGELAAALDSAGTHDAEVVDGEVVVEPEPPTEPDPEPDAEPQAEPEAEPEPEPGGEWDGDGELPLEEDRQAAMSADDYAAVVAEATPAEMTALARWAFANHQITGSVRRPHAGDRVVLAEGLRALREQEGAA